MKVAPMLSVPFVVQPKKEWHDKKEKKERLVLSDSESEVSEYDELDFVDEGDDVSLASNESSDSEFSLQKHLEKLLPGQVVDGVLEKKQADVSHLSDLKVHKKKRDRFRIFKALYYYIQELRAEERERRKHHLLREFEARIKKYDENMKEEIQRDIEEHKNAIALEEHRRQERIRVNSKAKVNKAAVIENFTKGLDKRDRERRDMDYYCTNLKKWAQEGFDTTEQRNLELQRIKEEKEVKAKELARIAAKKAAMDEDAAILAEDKRITAEIHTMMLKYGMIAYEDKAPLVGEERVDYILKRKQAKKSAKALADSHLESDEHIKNASANDPTKLRLSLRKDVDLLEINKTLKKNRHQRNRGKTALTPFKQDLSATGDVLAIKATHIKEVGALSLAAEFSRGACPMVESIDLSHCQIRTDGVGMLFQGFKAANLLTLRALNFSGNFIGPKGMSYMHEVCSANVFLNLKILNLNENELGDDGVGVLMNIIMEGHFQSLVHLFLQHNSITNHGFIKITGIMKSVQETKCPNIERIAIENNLVSPEVKRKHAPYPHYFSL